MIPPPQDSVEKALIDFKTAIDVDQDNAADLLMTIVERSNEIFDVKQNIAAQRAKKERLAHIEEIKEEKSMKTLMEDV
jgi:mannitol/fructose-specific phosphotransferase system IIA component